MPSHELNCGWNPFQHTAPAGRSKPGPAPDSDDYIGGDAEAGAGGSSGGDEVLAPKPAGVCTLAGLRPNRCVDAKDSYFARAYAGDGRQTNRGSAHRHRYTFMYKADAIELVELGMAAGHKMEEVCEENNFTLCNVSKWLKHADAIRAAAANSLLKKLKSSPGAGNPAKYKQLEHDLLAELRERRCCVRPTAVVAQLLPFLPHVCAHCHCTALPCKSHSSTTQAGARCIVYNLVGVPAGIGARAGARLSAGSPCVPRRCTSSCTPQQSRTASRPPVHGAGASVSATV